MNTSLNRALGAAHMLAQVCMTNDFQQHNREKVMAAAGRHGMEMLGEGNWSTAFAYDGDSYVVKVCFAAATDSSLPYMAWARANKGMPHVPNVYYLQRYKSGVYIAVLDRLSPCNEGMDYYEASSVLYGEAPAHDTPLERTCLAIREFFEGVARIDFHPANAMRTETGELVITDPISYVNSAPIKEGMERAYGVSVKQAA